MATVSRRPPGMRSMTGPTTGATTANGAIVSSRKSATLLRACAGSVLKNTDPARATAITASPAAIAAWVRASRVNGDAEATGRPARSVPAGSPPGTPSPERRHPSVAHRGPPART